MKPSLRLNIFCAVAALVMAGFAPAYAVSVFFDPSELTIDVGDTYTLDLHGIADPGDALLGYDLDLSFDPTQVNYLGVSSYGPNWVPPVVDPDGDGLAALWDPLTLPDFSGSSLLLATLEFECIGCGVSVINTFVDPVNGDRPLQEGVLQVIGGLTFDYEAGGAQITQVPVPVPAPIALISAGLLAFAMRRKLSVVR